MVKLEIGDVSVLLEQVDDPFLLFGREQLLAVMVAIIGAVAAKVVLEGVAQGRGVFLLHLVEERVEAPCRVNLPCWLEVGTVGLTRQSPWRSLTKTPTIFNGLSFKFATFATWNIKQT